MLSSMAVQEARFNERAFKHAHEGEGSGREDTELQHKSSNGVGGKYLHRLLPHHALNSLAAQCTGVDKCEVRDEANVHKVWEHHPSVELMLQAEQHPHEQPQGGGKRGQDEGV